MRGHAIRRFQDRNAKRKIRNRIIKEWTLYARHLAEDKKFIGKMAAVHGRPCSCFLCRGDDDQAKPRRLKLYDEEELYWPYDEEYPYTGYDNYGWGYDNYGWGYGDGNYCDDCDDHYDYERKAYSF